MRSIPTQGAHKKRRRPYGGSALTSLLLKSLHFAGFVASHLITRVKVSSQHEILPLRLERKYHSDNWLFRCLIRDRRQMLGASRIIREHAGSPVQQGATSSRSTGRWREYMKMSGYQRWRWPEKRRTRRRKPRCTSVCSRRPRVTTGESCRRHVPCLFSPLRINIPQPSRVVHTFA